MLKSFSLIIIWLLGSSFSSYLGKAENTKTTPILYSNNIHSLFEMLKEDSEGDQPLPNEKVFRLAISGFYNLIKKQQLPGNSTLTVIDFSLPSSKKRLWIIDMQQGTILYHSLVSHGRNSGDLMAKKFSNQISSYMSSLGFYLTGETYLGKHGYSLRLDGIDAGFNDNARERAIVIHGADYASENFVKTTGRLGRSLGCPALPMDIHKEVIDTIKEKNMLFIYGEDGQYLNNSPILRESQIFNG